MGSRPCDYLDHYKDVTIPEPETLFDDYSGRELPARDQQMTVANHLTPLDLKLVEQPGLTPEQQATFMKAYEDENKKLEESKLEGRERTKWNYQRFVKDYIRCVDAIDENVGRMLDYLDESGLAKNTVVFFTSDSNLVLPLSKLGVYRTCRRQRCSSPDPFRRGSPERGPRFHRPHRHSEDNPSRTADSSTSFARGLRSFDSSSFLFSAS